MGVPTFRQASNREAKNGIAKLNKSLAQQIMVDSTESAVSIDSLRALNNLYQRKRNGGQTRGIVFGLLGISAIAQAANSDDPSEYFGVVTLWFIAGTGIAQTSKYSGENFEKLIEEYKKNGVIPVKISKKLKEKDFR